MTDTGQVTPPDGDVPNTGGILPRGKVLFGMARSMIRREAEQQQHTWIISGGKLTFIPFEGYIGSQVLVLNGQTGLIGRVEQTADGLRCKCLINPRLKIGGLVKIDNKAINTINDQTKTPGGLLPYNQWAGLNMIADIAGDGLYRVYVIEYEGDSRSTPFYCDLTLLAMDPVTKTVVPGQ